MTATASAAHHHAFTTAAPVRAPGVMRLAGLGPVAPRA